MACGLHANQDSPTRIPMNAGLLRGKRDRGKGGMWREACARQLEGHVVQVGGHVGEGEGGVAVDGDLWRGRVLAHADAARVVDRVVGHLQRRAARADQACSARSAMPSQQPAHQERLLCISAAASSYAILCDDAVLHSRLHGRAGCAPRSACPKAIEAPCNRIPLGNMLLCSASSILSSVSDTGA